jgi:hypothetical protein
MPTSPGRRNRPRGNLQFAYKWAAAGSQYWSLSTVVRNYYTDGMVPRIRLAKGVLSEAVLRFCL